VRCSRSRCWAPAASLDDRLFTIGSAAAAVGVGRLSQRLGRRAGLSAGLSAGYLTGALGSLGVVAAASLGNVVLLFASPLIYGAGVSTNLQARYPGADLAAPSRRGRAISIVLVATAVGAIIGPMIQHACVAFVTPGSCACTAP
jgi:MFS family permease